jgi:hypothetical protein
MHKVPPGIPPNLALSLFGLNGTQQRILGCWKSARSKPVKQSWSRVPRVLWLASAYSDDADHSFRFDGDHYSE